MTTSQLVPRAHRPGRDPLSEALGAMRVAFVATAVFSFAVNLLMLTGPLFMLQVYDRVLASGSLPTLVVLFTLTLVLFGFMAVFDALRTRVMSRMGHALDARLGPLVFDLGLSRALVATGPEARPLQDLATLRGTVASPGFLALFDLPWVPFFLAIVFVFHWQLGVLATFAILVGLGLALLNERLSSKSAAQAMAAEIEAARFVERTTRHADAVMAMGMLGNVRETWAKQAGAAARTGQIGAERAEVVGAVSKAWRLLLQSAILGLGAFLAVRGEITPGMIIAASVISARALAPIDQVVGQWRGLLKAREARTRLVRLLAEAPAREKRLSLPAPKGKLTVSKLVVLAPPSPGTKDRRALLDGIDFTLAPGQGLGVIGPSTAGKSTLARLLVGIARPDSGSVRLDGAPFEQWEPDEIGRFVGYLPQSVELLPGTIAQNIARFDERAESSEIVAAAQLAGVHELVLSLPEGYATRIGYGPSPLSGGQVQRIGLARAVFRRPPLVVLDEPNANLDADGDLALTRAIANLRAAGSSVVVMAHRPSAIAAVDHILMLEGGRQRAFGPKAEILPRVAQLGPSLAASA